jgi:hypothetical protein
LRTKRMSFQQGFPQIVLKSRGPDLSGSYGAHEQLCC